MPKKSSGARTSDPGLRLDRRQLFHWMGSDLEYDPQLEHRKSVKSSWFSMEITRRVTFIPLTMQEVKLDLRSCCLTPEPNMLPCKTTLSAPCCSPLMDHRSRSWPSMI